MKNFLIIVLAFGLTAAAFATRPDREDFDRYLARKQKAESTTAASLPPIAIFRKSTGTAAAANAGLTSAGSASSASGKQPTTVVEPGKLEYKDFLLWTVVKQDGKTLYTSVFAH